MPQKRSATVASGRLPLGTPIVTVSSQRTSSRNTQHSSDLEVASHDSADTKSSTFVNMSNSNDFSHSAASLAQAKLQRQQERIKQAEAALFNPPPVVAYRCNPERALAAAFDKKSIWEPATSNDGSEGRVEVRVNKYSAAPSRDHSLSRSLSSVSQQTSFDRPETENDANDDAGFQVWTRRGGRSVKAAGDGTTYSEKPDIEKQKTVEATYDKNQILEVFKQVLPSPDFLGTFPGTRDGQVQFVQHPNGDVAAHMWSAHNWMWDNIGHFSNIRKKTEGQLAGERLKGETAYQKLQQHTLAYFRILAKQREATKTGTAFGQDNIKSALPEPVLAISPKEDVADAQKENLVSRAASRTFSIPMPVERPSQPFIPIVSPQQDDPFSADTRDYSNAFSWQSKFDSRSNGFAAQQHHLGHDRRQQVSSDSTPTREALRDQLHKTVDIATKRSLSQANLANLARTVLHDPMQASSYDDQRFEPSPPTFSAGYKFYSGWQDQQQHHGTQFGTARKTSALNIGSFPDVDDFEPVQAVKAQDIHALPHHTYTAQPISKPVKKSYDEELHDWWTGGTKFARQEELFRTIMRNAPKPARSSASTNAAAARPGAIGSERSASPAETASGYNETTTRLFIPIYENLASYVQGPTEQTQNYWSRWSQPPDWCIDRGPNGNNSFFDHNWGQPPARVGRDPRFRHDCVQFGNLSPMASSAVGSPGAHAMSRFGNGRY